jgi:predicted RNA binding protein YcfA (HicA-like mRNA interferase family)
MQSELRDILKKLKAGGWVFDRSTGGHNIFKHDVKIGTIVVPGHWSGDRRLFKKILCDIKNGTKFERLHTASTASPTPTKEPVVSSISAATKENVMKAMSQKANPPSAPTLPFAVAKGPPRGRTGKARMKFSDEQILSAATIFEEGGTIVKAARALRCSGPTAKHCLVAFFGEEQFNRLQNMTPKERRKATKEKAKAARTFAAAAPAMEKILVGVMAPPVEAPEPPKPAQAFPSAAAVAEARRIEPPFHLSDIRTMNATIVAGVASVELTMNMNSPSFQTLCKWAQGK